MSPELDHQLSQLVEAINNGSHVVVAEYVKWYLFKCYAGVAAAVLFGITLIAGSVVIGKSAYPLEDQTADGKAGRLFFGVGVPLVAFLLFSAIATSQILGVVKGHIAPSVVVLDYVSNQIKR